MKRIAFTLAEVLITLGIIGIVAAMTIPNLITEHQKRATVTKLERAISVINQAYKLSYDDNGDLDEVSVASMDIKEYFSTYWEPYIKVLTICSGNHAACGYDSNRPFYSVGYNKGELYLGSSTDASRLSFLTMDGFMYMILGYLDNNKNRAFGLIIVDINGGEKPNRYGRDVFVLQRVPDGKGVQPYGYDLSDSAVDKGCAPDTPSSIIYQYCAERIRRAGWTIDKSYPWK